MPGVELIQYKKDKKGRENAILRKLILTLLLTCSQSGLNFPLGAFNHVMALVAHSFGASLGRRSFGFSLSVFFPYILKLIDETTLEVMFFLFV